MKKKGGAGNLLKNDAEKVAHPWARGRYIKHTDQTGPKTQVSGLTKQLDNIHLTYMSY